MTPLFAESEAERIVIAFREHCRDERFDRFVRELDQHGRHTARLRYWQEQLWTAFAESFDGTLPQTPVEIAALFKLSIPGSVLHWVQLDDNGSYVLDLVQLADGSRYLQPRMPDDPITPHTVFSTCVATGRELRACIMSSGLAKLDNGEDFAVEAHGVWMTVPEANLLFKQIPPSDGKSPWINGMAPRLPPK
jgi:hypothetical protein